ncbi:hypothetical protein ACGFRB_18280 [Streptomyces sp. NPDC048718]|uniref:hypothetical protein n=1 Tax=Streptomyces sp. NPDC048718 TaxID=3365587 RepID=UPI003716B99A
MSATRRAPVPARGAGAVTGAAALSAPGPLATLMALVALAALVAPLTGCAQAKQKASDISASAQQRMREVAHGVDATDDVKAGPTSTDADGRTIAAITVTNRSDKTADFTAWVNFRDKDGKLLDAVVLNIGGVGPGAFKSATARSNRKLSGATKAEVAQALRH